MPVGKVSRKVEAEKENKERWLLTYADMITLLLALFVILYATSKIDVPKFERVAASLARAFGKEAVQGRESRTMLPLGESPNIVPGDRVAQVGEVLGPTLAAYAQQEGLEQELSVEVSKEGLVIRMSGAMPFPSGSAELKREAREALALVADVLKTLDLPVRVDGHTDNVLTGSGRYATNWDLSAARAASTARQLVENGVPPDRVAAAGYGEFRPIDTNNTPGGRQRNRRVEIWVLPEEMPNAVHLPGRRR